MFIYFIEHFIDAFPFVVVDPSTFSKQNYSKCIYSSKKLVTRVSRINHVLRTETFANHVSRTKISASRVSRTKISANHVLRPEKSANQVSRTEISANHVSRTKIRQITFYGQKNRQIAFHGLLHQLVILVLQREKSHIYAVPWPFVEKTLFVQWSVYNLCCFSTAG